MKILKVINNNVVICMDDTERESVAMGKGLGFASRPGMTLSTEKVEKIFRLENQSDTDRLKQLFSTISEEQIELCSRIIRYAGESLSRILNPSIYLTLTDHINFAISRVRSGIVFHNALLAEVRTFYPREFSVGKYAVELIRDTMGISFSEDEAASIALHLVNAEQDTSISDTLHMTQALHDILEILEQSRTVTLQKDSPYFDEFTVCLKFLVARTFQGQNEEWKQPDLVEAIRKNDPQEYACAALVAEYLEKQSRHPVTSENIAYLAAQIRRVNAQHHAPQS